MNSMARQLGILGALFSGVAVAAGAFGAHGLRDLLPPDRLTTFETAAQYQMYHGLALLAIAALASRNPSPSLRYAGLALTFGIVVFSGSLYLLAASGLRVLGAITPIGGVLFIGGWLTLAWSLFRTPAPSE